MLDGLRVKPMACYDFICRKHLVTRVSAKKIEGMEKRLWCFPRTSPMTSNDDIASSYLALDDGAKKSPKRIFPYHSIL